MMKLVVVTGADGSGKTTLCDALYLELKKLGVRTSLVTIWDVLDKNLFVTNVKKTEIDGYLKRCSNTSRSLFLLHSLAQAMEHGKKEHPEVIIVNSYWYKYFVSEVLHGSNKTWLQSIVTCFDSPDLVINLEIDPKLSFQRKTSISSYESGHSQNMESGYLDFQNKAIPLWNELKSNSWINLSSKETREKLLSHSIEILKSKGIIA